MLPGPIPMREKTDLQMLKKIFRATLIMAEQIASNK